MTGLEALKELKFNLVLPSQAPMRRNYKDICFEVIEKELKALELLIKKDVIIPKLTLTKFFDIKEYNKDLSERRQLTDEERTLILEVLKELEK